MAGKSDNIFVSVLEKGEVFCCCFVCVCVFLGGEGGGIYSDIVALFTTTHLSPAVVLKATVLLIPLPSPPPTTTSPLLIALILFLQSQCT